MTLAHRIRILFAVMVLMTMFYLQCTTTTGLYETTPPYSDLPQPQPQQPQLSNGMDHQHRPTSPWCVSWDINTDDWWTHNPQWYISDENETHFCFSRHDDSNAILLDRLHQVQFHSNCSAAGGGIYKDMVSSGWASDWTHVMDGLQYALDNAVPFALEQRGPWHYAASSQNNKTTTTTCPSQGVSCYFLNITNCSYGKYQRAKIAKERVSYDTKAHTWLYDYATRPQQWLRRDVYNYVAQQMHIVAPCTVLHVRRADVVLHGKSSRRYHNISEYMTHIEQQQQQQQQSTKNVFLLTDDQNAIDEAQHDFPDYHWMYLNRPRHRGAEGGWENQVPSKDPKFEVVVLLSTFKLVERCHAMVHSSSSLAYLMRHFLREGSKIVNIDDGVEFTTIYSKKYAQERKKKPK
jgi:Alpha-(1,6)-fucosyltransferase N- and catalytic domains